MSKYTTEVRFICESANGLTDSVGFSKVNEIIQGAIPKIFDFDFPIYDESYRNVLCSKILKHYYTREIGLETVGLWKLHLDMRLNEIMPYYNQLYKSAMIEFNPMYDIDLTTTMDRDTGGVTETNNEDKTVNNFTDEKTTQYNNTDETNVDSTSTQRDLFSDTPQGSLDNVENETYLTNARKNTNETDGHSITTANNSGTETLTRTGSDTVTKTGNTTLTSTEDYVMKVSGKNGGTSYSKMLKEFRDTFINIDLMIVNSLSDLFLNLW